MNKTKKLLTFLLALLLILGAAALGVFLALKKEGVLLNSYESEETNPRDVISRPDESGLHADDSDWSNTITYKGEKWKKNHGLQTVAFFGVDQSVEVQSNNIIGTSGRADTILVIVLNGKEKTMKILQISRDTMINVDLYNDRREKVFTSNMQITLQYAFGANPTHSNYLMKNKISDLLYGIHIDGCCAVTVEGMSKIVEAMGGITLKLEEDWTDIDPTYTRGSTVTMDGNAVNRFVRYRDTDTTGSNSARMERQAWFFEKLLSIMRKHSGSELMDWLDSAGDEVTSDLEAETMQSISRYELDGEMITLPGEIRAGEKHDEYILDEDALRTLILETFYVKVD